MNDFKAKTGAVEGAEQLLSRLAAFTHTHVLPTLCFVHRVDAKLPVFTSGTIVLSFLYSVHALLSRGSDSMTKLAADTPYDSIGL
jgi:hypothetical protein